MKLNLFPGTLDAAKESTHIIGVFEDSKTALHRESLDELANADVFKGKKGSSYFLRSLSGGTNILFLGLGKAKDLNGEALRVAGATAAQKLSAEKIKAAAIAFDTFRQKDVSKKLDVEKSARYLSEGFLFSLYHFSVYKSEKPKDGLSSASLQVADKKAIKAAQSGLKQAVDTNDAITLARDLSNEPGSVLVPMELAKRAQKVAKENKLSCKVLTTKELKKENMAGVLGVGQGSANPPCVIVLEYKPKKKAKKTIAFVGKGVTFDSGGISIKPGANMEDMKHDMSGAADVLAAIVLASRLQSPHHIVCVIAAAENMPSGNAMIPSHIIKTRSGKTVEVQNTDAEGRLVLMEALDYVQEYKPAVIIDVATLTGAVVMALGNAAAGIMGNDQSLLSAFKEAAAETGERYWELPLYKEYCDDIKSKIADIKNIGSAGSGAGSQKGGAFLQEFIKPGQKWMHVDIAGTAWGLGYQAYHPKHGASGHTVRTLAQFAMDY